MVMALPYAASAAGTAAAGTGAAAGTAAVGTGITAAGIAQGVGALAAIGGTAASLDADKRAQRAAEKAAEVDSAQAAISNQRSIRQNVLRSRVQRAQAESQGQAQTGSFHGSSSVTGAIGAAQTQNAANIGFARQTQAANAGVNRALTEQSQQRSRAGQFGAIANLPGQFGFDIESIFGGN